MSGNTLPFPYSIFFSNEPLTERQQRRGLQIAERYLRDEALAELRRLSELKPEPVETVTSTGVHDWHRDTRPGAVSWPYCARCGIVQRHDGKNKPCPGTVHVTPRGSGR